MKDLKFIKKAFPVFIGLALIFSVIYLPGRILVVDEQPQYVDAIIVISGDGGPRMDKAVELFNSGYSSRLIISGGRIYRNITMAELMRLHAIELGIPPEAIILDNLADSTYQNALYTKQIMSDYGFKSAIVVSSSYHMKRTKYTYDKVFNGSDIKLVYCAATNNGYTPETWWSNNRNIILTVTEYVKFLGYLLGRHT